MHMRKFVFGAALAAAMGAASLANAAIVTFDIEWSGEVYENAATATGFITIDDALLPSGDEGGVALPSAAVVDLGIDITGAAAGNGHYSLPDFGSVVFASISPLNLRHQLIGQIMSNGCAFGTSHDDVCGDGNGGDFNLFGQTGLAPFGTWFFELAADGGNGDKMAVTSMIARGADAGVPEPASWALMIGGFGLAGGALRRRRRLAAAA